jgi:thiamine pyrophosphate-dependent acetolactate synthase large subunit-like protein
MSMRQAMEALAAALPDGAVTVLDGNVSMLTAQQVIAVNEPLARLTAGANGTMGVGIPFAIAAKLHDPARPVVAVCGDSAFGFSAMELETAVRHGVGIVVVVMNNQGLSGGLVQAAHYPPDHERVAMLGAGVRNERVMEAFGGVAARAETAGDLGEAVHRALASGRPACIDCIVDPMSELPAHVSY